MKKFSFPLDRVLNWRRLECERERARLEQRIAEHGAVEQRAFSIRRERDNTGQGIAEARVITGTEVATLVHWQMAVRRQLKELEIEEAKAADRIREQRTVVQEAESKVRLLERLREKRHGQWTVDLAREEETFATEVHLARFVRMKTK